MNELESERVALNSDNPHDERASQLRSLFPEAFSDGTFDAESIDELINRDRQVGTERYGLSWAGKTDAVRLMQSPSVGTLRPSESRSVGFDEAKHLFIEGDNLEVLKLLQKSYHGSIKLIYIDPPYNTGQDFVYRDDYRQGVATYLEYSGQSDATGQQLVANPETSGRYHSDWLSMMYPRLALARNLLKQDGLIFVSIDDHEVGNLRLVLDEVFGPTNFLASLIWNTGHSQQQGIFKAYHQYVLVYARDASEVTPFADPSGGEIVAGAMKKVSKANPKSEFTFPAGVRCEAEDGTELKGTWGDAETVELVDGRFLVEDGALVEQVTLAAGWTQKRQMEEFFYGEGDVFDTRGQKVLEFYFNSNGKLKCRKERGAITPPTVQSDWGTQGKASQALQDFFDGVEAFDRPKPVQMIRDFVAWTTGTGDLVLDFFAGSGTTGHAVIEQNQADGEERQFILVNLPEMLEESSEARQQLDLETVSDVCLARLARVFEQTGKSDAGFRMFQLDESNFSIWNPEEVPTEPAALAEHLRLFSDNVSSDASASDLIYEILLKEGVELTAELEAHSFDGVEVISTGDLGICVSTSLNLELIKKIAALDLERVVLLESAFNKIDDLKANSRHVLREAGTTLRTI